MPISSTTAEQQQEILAVQSYSSNTDIEENARYDRAEENGDDPDQGHFVWRFFNFTYFNYEILSLWWYPIQTDS